MNSNKTRAEINEIESKSTIWSQQMPENLLYNDLQKTKKVQINKIKNSSSFYE